MMTARRDGYSTAVGALKVLLPLAALGLLSTLFIFSGEVDPSQSIPYAELNVEQLAEEQRVTAPYLAGVTPAGAAVTFTGSAVIPDLQNPDRFTFEDLDARIETASARVLTAVAARADVAGDLGTAEFAGGTVIETSDNIRITTDGLLVTIATADLETTGPIKAEGGFGTITAQKMTMTRPSPDLPHEIVFQGDVRMIYVPEE